MNHHLLVSLIMQLCSTQAFVIFDRLSTQTLLKAMQRSRSLTVCLPPCQLKWSDYNRILLSGLKQWQMALFLVVHSGVNENTQTRSFHCSYFWISSSFTCTLILTETGRIWIYAGRHCIWVVMAHCDVIWAWQMRQRREIFHHHHHIYTCLLYIYIIG